MCLVDSLAATVLNAWRIAWVASRAPTPGALNAPLLGSLRVQTSRSWPSASDTSGIETLTCRDVHQGEKVWFRYSCQKNHQTVAAFESASILKFQPWSSATSAAS